MKHLPLFLSAALLLAPACADDDTHVTDVGDASDATDTTDAAADAVTDAADGSGDATDTPDEVITDLNVEAEFTETASVGQNTLEITVTSGSGAPVPGATVTVDPQMPMMGHGSTEEAEVTDNGDGTYTAFPVTFQMGGPWVVTITAELGDVSAETELSVNVGR